MTQDRNTQDLVLTRVFNAPREKVWEAWTNPEQLKKWWGPKDFTAPEMTSDLRKGGAYLYCVQAPNGQKIYITGIFKEIKPPEKLIFTGGFADEHGNTVPGSYYGMDGHERGIQTVQLEDLDDKTKLTLRQEGLPSEKIAEEDRSWNQSFDKLAQIL